MSTNNITEVRGHLFDTLRDLREGKIDIEKADAVNRTAQTIINSAKVEVDFIKHTGAQGSGFIPKNTPALPDGIVGRTFHKCR